MFRRHRFEASSEILKLLVYQDKPCAIADWAGKHAYSSSQVKQATKTFALAEPKQSRQLGRSV